MALPSYATSFERVWHYIFLGICWFVLIFLVFPIFIIIPLSFNAEPYFTFNEQMLSIVSFSSQAPFVHFDFSGYSYRFYQEAWYNQQWREAFLNSAIVAVFATLFATILGTVAALGLSMRNMPWKAGFMSLLISPMIVPLVIVATGMFFFFSMIEISPVGTFLSENVLFNRFRIFAIILAHTALATPFVVITVTATLVGFDQSLTRASAMLGAGPTRTFFKVIVPLILPGVISGVLFAFITSFDEVVVVLFLAGPGDQTIPKQMFSGIRENISPTIFAVASGLIMISILLLVTVEILRRRSERLRGIKG